MRKRGFSYSEIQSSIQISKSTLSSWLREVKLSDFQLERLQKKRNEIARRNAQKRIFDLAHKITEIKNSAAENIGAISKRELWLMGLMLFWQDKKNKKALQFTSADPQTILFFLKWLRDIGKIKENEMGFDIFISKEKKEEIHRAVVYWSKLTGFRQIYFNTAYYLQTFPKKGIRKISTRAPYGYLRIRVKASSMLARQIAGWVRGIEISLGLGQ